MKFEIDSIQACNNAWNIEDRFEEILKLYPYLKGKVNKFIDSDNNTKLVIEINTLEELTNLVDGCRYSIVYDASNEVDDKGFNGNITIYDDYME